MTKKSNNRKYKLGEAPIRYRNLDLDVPMVLYSRLLKIMASTVEKGLIPATMTPREFSLIAMANGVALAEADLYKREREGSLVVTPDEAQDISKRLQDLKKRG